MTQLCPEQSPALSGANPCSGQSRCIRGEQRWAEGCDFPLGSAPKVITGDRAHGQAQSLPGSSQELPPAVTAKPGAGQGRWLQHRSCGCGTGGIRLSCCWERLFLAAEREAWPGAHGAVLSCSILSWLGAWEAADVLTLGLGAFKGCSASSSPDLLQVSPDGLSVWIKHAECCKYN